VQGPGLPPDVNGHPAVLQLGSANVKPIYKSVKSNQIYLDLADAK
jgi:hypothetical protein